MKQNRENTWQGEKTLEQVPPVCAELYRKAVADAAASNLNSAIADFVTALEIEPGFFACREALRGAAVSRSAARPPRFSEKLAIILPLSKASLIVGRRPMRALALAEQTLLRVPASPWSHKLFAKAALAAHFPRTALLSLQALEQQAALSRALQLKLGQTLTRTGHSSEAATLFGRMLKDNPRDSRLLREVESLVHQHPHELAPLPTTEASPSVPSEPSVSAVRSDAVSQYEELARHCPKNTKVLRTLGDAYLKKHEFDKSLECYRRVLAVAGDRHPEMKGVIAEVEQMKFEGNGNPKPQDPPQVKATKENEAQLGQPSGVRLAF